MYEDNEYIDAHLLLNKTSVSIALAVFTVVFQAGFFWSMPIELMTFMSPGHLLINSAVIVPVFGVFVGVVYWFWVWFCEIVERGGDLTEISIFKIMSAVERNWLLFGFVLVLLIFTPMIFPDHKYRIDIFYTAIHGFLLLIGSIFGFSMVLWNFSVMLRDIDIGGRFRRDGLLRTVITFVATSFSMGMLYGQYIAGEECVFVSGNQIQTAQLIMSLDGVVALRKDNQILLLSSRNLDSIACPPMKSENLKMHTRNPADNLP